MLRLCRHRLPPLPVPPSGPTHLSRAQGSPNSEKSRLGKRISILQIKSLFNATGAQTTVRAASKVPRRLAVCHSVSCQIAWKSTFPGRLAQKCPHKETSTADTLSYTRGIRGLRIYTPTSWVPVLRSLAVHCWIPDAAVLDQPVPSTACQDLLLPPSLYTCS